MTRGILAYGAYVPRLRLSRRAMAETNQWFAPELKAQGERAMCNFDEDPVTMAVEAARDALAGRDRASLSALSLASTTLPFVDRLNAAIVTKALNLHEAVATLDIGGTQRAGTSALVNALSGKDGEALVIASEKRQARAASAVEMITGDAAAAILVGEGKVAAKLLAAASHTADFVDHFRSEGMDYNYFWEERWIRDEGYMRIVPSVIAECLGRAGLAAADVTHFCMPAILPRVAQSVAKAAGISPAALRDNLHATVGDTGVGHPLLMLVGALEDARAGDRIMVVGFGQGADAVLFEVTPEIADQPRRAGLKGHVARRKEETNYARYLAFNELVTMERGMRAEADKLTALSALWRNSDTVTSFIGGRCQSCSTLQFPKSNICVNPNCNAFHSQQPHPFAEMVGRIKSYTADRLTYSPAPPACYGMVQFDEGGRVMIDFTDVDSEALKVGQAMRMTFRIKDVDKQRGFRRYFWKAAPTMMTEA